MRATVRIIISGALGMIPIHLVITTGGNGNKMKNRDHFVVKICLNIQEKPDNLRNMLKLRLQ